MKTRKFLAILLTLAMIAGLLCTSAAATGPLSLAVPENRGVGTIQLSGVDRACGTSIYIDETFNNGNYTNHRYTYYITLPPTTADNAQLTITFAAATGANTVFSPVPPQGYPPQFYQMIMGYASTTYTVNLSSGTGSKTVYAHRELSGPPNYTNYGQCDVYIFNFEKGYPVSISTGDPVYIAWDTTDVTEGTVAMINGGTNYPNNFTLWVDTLDEIILDNSPLPDDSDLSHDNNYAFPISFTSSEQTITVAYSQAETYTITVPAKTGGGNPSPQGVAPNSVVSYLPIGQFATGAGWGIATGKFAGKTSLESTGVSLGALGGYIEFDYDDPDTTEIVEGITNDPRNPYGVDFVVYGNAFNGNPEAGAVQVSENGIVWYELAGSRYYDSTPASVSLNSGFSSAYTGTLRNASVTYTLLSNGISASATNGTATLSTGLFTPNTSWWPTTTEYPEFNATNYPTIGNTNTNSNVTVSYGGDATGSTLVFGGVTAVQDSNTTADYAFGYADVTPNGSPSDLGDAVNPYIAYTSSKTGGDGFDLEWAVDISTGLPVDVSGKTFRYVRVYSAVLDNGTFGETSAEVCGIFTAYRTPTEEALDEETGVGRTSTPTILVDNTTTIADYASANSVTPTQIGNVTYYDFTNNSIPSGKVITATGATNTYINSTNTTSLTTNANTEFIRIVAQTGDAAPSITLIKVK